MKVEELFYIFWHKIFVRCTFHEYFLACALSTHFINNVFWQAEYLMKANIIIIFFYGYYILWPEQFLPHPRM